MTLTLRSRLLLLVFAGLLPALLGLGWVSWQALAAEREARQRSLHESARGMVGIVEREIGQRAAIARVLALAAGPAGERPEARWLQRFEQQARAALVGMQGWVELRSAQRLLLDTRLPPGRAAGLATAAAGLGRDGPKPLAQLPIVRPLRLAADGSATALIQPVPREGSEGGAGRTALNVVVTLTQAELQQLLDAQRLPADWTAMVLDSHGVILAHHPADRALLGRPAAPDLRERIARRDEGAFESVSGAGLPLQGWLAVSAQGWAYAGAMPRETAASLLPMAARWAAPGALAGLGLAAVLALLAPAAAGATAVAGMIAAELRRLGSLAAPLPAGLQVEPVRTRGIPEFDAVARTMAEASSTLRDQRSQLESQLAAAVEHSRQAGQALAEHQRAAVLGRLAAGIVHDFNNLLGLISNHAHLLQRQLQTAAQTGPSTAAPLAGLASILRAVDAGSQLTQPLARLTDRRARQPQPDLQRQPLVLARWLPQQEDLLRMALGKHIRLTLQAEPEVLPIVADPAGLELALIHLALRAREAMPAGGHFRVRAGNAAAHDCAGLPPGAYVLITVADDGVGMTPEAAQHAFEPFAAPESDHRDDGRGEDPGGDPGSGPGLSPVRAFCLRAAGEARLASVAGVGTRVSMLLPAAPGSASPAPAENASPSAGATLADPTATSIVRPATTPSLAPSITPILPTMVPPALPPALAGARVLLVEDNTELADATVALLESHGARVRHAGDAADALALLRQQPGCDLVLSDVMMPGPMDGLSLARQLRRDRPGLPVLLTTGFSGAAAGAAAEFRVLPKPTHPEDLLRALSEALEA